jgi:hypothetical protein
MDGAPTPPIASASGAMPTTMVSGAAADTNMNTMSRVPIAFFLNPPSTLTVADGMGAASSLVKAILLL